MPASSTLTRPVPGTPVGGVIPVQSRVPRLALFLLLPFWFGASFPAERGAGMVATDHALASECGAEILHRGGNAADAAVAAALCAGVVQPAGSGLGGGGFALFVPAGEAARGNILDFRETAPAAATEDMYRSADGEVKPTASRVGGDAVGVPGESRGLAALLTRYGVLTPREVAAPAIRLATRGWRMHPHLAGSLHRTKYPEIRELFGVGDRVATHGDLVRNPALARTLRRWASTGGEDLSAGAGAKAIVDAVARAGGRLTVEDLEGYAVKERAPIVVEYKGWTLLTMPPPSSGGVFIGQMLQVLEGYDLNALGHNSSDYVHLLAEVMQHAFADRATYLGDPDFVDVPVDRLLSEERVAEIRSKVWPGRTWEASYYGEVIEPHRDAGTQHISVMDSSGNAVALTTTINTSFGSGVVPMGLGLVLNNEMDDFAAAPGVPNAYGLVGNEANAVAPGKRPLSSMSPTVLVDPDGNAKMVVGASGGSTIITGTLQAILNMVDWKMDPQAAVSAPRIHHQWQPAVLFVEPEFAADVVGALEGRGHEVVVRPSSAAVQAVAAGDGDHLLGGSDPRKGGRPAGTW